MYQPIIIIPIIYPSHWSSPTPLIHTVNILMLCHSFHLLILRFINVSIYSSFLLILKTSTEYIITFFTSWVKLLQNFFYKSLWKHMVPLSWANIKVSEAYESRCVFKFIINCPTASRSPFIPVTMCCSCLYLLQYVAFVLSSFIS